MSNPKGSATMEELVHTISENGVPLKEWCERVKVRLEDGSIEERILVTNHPPMQGTVRID